MNKRSLMLSFENSRWLPGALFLCHDNTLSFPPAANPKRKEKVNDRHLELIQVVDSGSENIEIDFVALFPTSLGRKVSPGENLSERRIKFRMLKRSISINLKDGSLIRHLWML